MAENQQSPYFLNLRRRKVLRNDAKTSGSSSMASKIANLEVESSSSSSTDSPVSTPDTRSPENSIHVTPSLNQTFTLHRENEKVLSSGDENFLVSLESDDEFGSQELEVFRLDGST